MIDILKLVHSVLDVSINLSFGRMDLILFLDEYTVIGVAGLFSLAGVWCCAYIG